VLVRLFAVTKYLKKQVKNILEWGRGGREGTVSEVSVHPGREAHLMATRKQKERILALADFLHLPLLLHLGLQPTGWCHPHSRWVFLP
jgi:hypothetical protein